MTTPLDIINSAILGNPVNPNKKPSRQGVIAAFAEIQKQLEAAQSGAIVKGTKATLPTQASLNIMAWVTSDATLAFNGIYENTGTAAVAGAVWTRRTDIPQFVISGLNVGAGTANAIQVTTDLPVPTQDGRCLVLVPILANNTISPPTVKINNSAFLPIISNSGNNININGLSTGMIVAGFISAGNFRLLSDQASASIVAAAEAVKINIDKNYLGDRTTLPTLNNDNTALIVGARLFLTVTVGVNEPGEYRWNGSIWEMLGIIPVVYERVENVFATNNQTIVPVPGGYNVGTIKVFRNGVNQKIGSSIGVGATDNDCSASDGVNVVFPASVLSLNNLITFYMTTPYVIGVTNAADVTFVPAGGIAATNVQSALVEVGADRDAAIATAVAALIGAAPGALNTLAELADALGSDAAFSTTVANALALRAPLLSPTFTGVPSAPTPTLGDNTTKIATMQALDNALTLKATLLSPTFTGVPSAPTPTLGDNTTKLATMQALQAAITASTGAGLVFISSGVNPGASLSIALGTTYRRFLLKLRRFEPVTAGSFLRMNVATDGVPNYITTANYSFSAVVTETGSATVSAWSGTVGEFQLAAGQPAATGNFSTFDIEIENAGPAYYSGIMWRARTRTSAGVVNRTTNGAGEFIGNSDRWTHVRLQFTAGNIGSAAEWALYGMKE